MAKAPAKQAKESKPRASPQAAKGKATAAAKGKAASKQKATG
jgi:hypothetical protein